MPKPRLNGHPQPRKYREANLVSLANAFRRARNAVIDDRSVTGSSSAAGFVMPADWPHGEGFQVFVRVVRYSDKYRKVCPSSGGLLEL